MHDAASANSSEERGSRTAQRIGLILGPLLALLCLSLDDLTSAQRVAAAVTALTATFWVTVAIPVGAASLLPAALFPLGGVLSAQEAATPYMSNLVILFVGAFIVALGLERWGVHRRIALLVIAVVGTAERRLVLGFMVAAAFLSMWINNTATTLMMLPIGLAVIERSQRAGASAGASRGFASCLLLGIAYASSVGGMGTPVGTAPNQEFLGQFRQAFPDGPQISFGEWFLGWTPFVLLFVVVAWLLMTRVLFSVGGSDHSGAAGAEVVRAERKAQGPMGRGARSMAIVFGATALLWVTRADLSLGDWTLPGWNRWFYGDVANDPAWYAAHKNDVSDSTVALAMAVVCFLIPVDFGRGQFLMDWKTARKLPWDVLLLLGGGICIAKGFRTSGLDGVVGGALSPWFADRSDWLVVGGVALFVTFLTELTSNTATTAVLLPVLAQAAVQSGLNPLMLMLPATLAASSAFMLPAATPPNAVVFASRLVPIGRMARVGLWLNLVTVVLLTIVFQLWVRRLWGIEADLPSWAE